METQKNIYQRLNAVMQEVSYIQKLDKKVNNMYRFVSHDLVSSKIQPQLVKHGIVCIPVVTGHLRDGNMTVLEVEVKFINIDNPLDFVVTKMIGYGIDGTKDKVTGELNVGDKGPGKAMSYAVKYALLKTFCLETGDDPDYEPEVKHEKDKEEVVETPEEAEKILNAYITFKHSARLYGGDEEMCKKYLCKYAAHWKKSMRETCNIDYDDINKFNRDFEKWKSQQPKT